MAQDSGFVGVVLGSQIQLAIGEQEDHIAAGAALLRREGGEPCLERGGQVGGAPGEVEGLQLRLEPGTQRGRGQGGAREAYCAR